MSTELLKIPKLTRPEDMPMIVLSESGKAYLEEAEKITLSPIQPGPSLIVANETANTLNRLIKAVDNKRKEATKPMRDFLSEYKALADSKTKRPTEIFLAIRSGITECDNKIQAEYQEKMRVAAAEEERRRKIQAAHEAKGHKVKADITPVAREISPDITSPIKWRKEWKVTEITDMAKVPREYMIIDTIKLRAAVKSGIREIPGVEIEEVKTQIHG